MSNHVHSLNTSSGKQKYSFSKSSRFDAYRPTSFFHHSAPTSPTFPSSLPIAALPSLAMVRDPSKSTSFTTLTLTLTKYPRRSITKAAAPLRRADMYFKAHSANRRPHGNSEVQPKHPGPQLILNIHHS